MSLEAWEKMGRVQSNSEKKSEPLGPTRAASFEHGKNTEEAQDETPITWSHCKGIMTFS